MSSATKSTRADSLTGAWLAARWAVDPARVDAMRRAGELIGVREPGSTEWRYPSWQLEGSTPRRSIRRIVAAGREAGLDEDELYDVLTTPRGLTGGDRRSLVDALLEGREDDVIAAVRAGH